MSEVNFFFWDFLLRHWVMVWLLVCVLCLLFFTIITRLKAEFSLSSQVYKRLWRFYENIDLRSAQHQKSKPVSRFFQSTKLHHWYVLAGFNYNFTTVLFWFGGVVVGLFIWGVLTSEWFWTLVLISFIFIAFFGFIYLKALERRQKLVGQIPMFLQSLSNALQAGYTLEQSLSFIAQEMSQPLQGEILKIHNKLQLQVSIEEALADFAELLNNPEVDFFVESTLIQLKTGGNLVILFQKIAYLIEEKLKLNRDIKSFTSQGKLSGILVAVLWPASLLAFSWLSPQHTDVLFNTVQGQSLLGISILLEVIGFWFIWKIITIKI